MTFPGSAQVKVLSPSKTVKVVVSRGKPIYSRAGTKQIQAGVSSVDVVFTTPTTDTNWVYGALTIVNVVDGVIDRQFITCVPSTAPSQSGFTVQLSEETNTANSVLHWSIAEAYSP